MFTFSKPYDRDTSDIKQMLVFPHVLMQKKFTLNLLQKRLEASENPNDFSCPSELGLGAIFKLQAVHNERGKWDARICCCVQDTVLFEREDVSEKWNTAMAFAASHLRDGISEAFNKEISSLSDNFVKL